METVGEAVDSYIRYAISLEQLTSIRQCKSDVLHESSRGMCRYRKKVEGVACKGTFKKKRGLVIMDED